ncbi:hypothetical protein EMCRGX_G012940 [Ephydatia muelleri]
MSLRHCNQRVEDGLPSTVKPFVASAEATHLAPSPVIHGDKTLAHWEISQDSTIQCKQPHSQKRKEAGKGDEYGYWSGVIPAKAAMPSGRQPNRLSFLFSSLFLKIFLGTVICLLTTLLLIYMVHVYCFQGLIAVLFPRHVGIM